MSMGLGWQTVLAPRHRVPDDLGDLPPGSLEKGGNTDGYSSFIGMNRDSKWGFVAMTNVNDDDFQQVISHAVSPMTAKMPILWPLVQKDPSPLSGTYEIKKGRPTLDVFKYRGNVYAWISTGTPAKLRRLAPNAYAWDEASLSLTFNIAASGRATSLIARQNCRAFRAIRIR